MVIEPVEESEPRFCSDKWQCWFARRHHKRQIYQRILIILLRFINKQKNAFDTGKIFVKYNDRCFVPSSVVIS